MEQKQIAGEKQFFNFQDKLQKFIPILVACITFIVFLPMLNNDFVNFDDNQFLIQNNNYKGLGWTQLYWMFKTIFAGNYVPLTWLAWAADYQIWGMNPLGYHLGNLLLHTVNAVLFYHLAFKLLDKAVPVSSQDERKRFYICAGISALFFSIHPLRVESVAWAVERRDVLSGFFYLLTVIFYIRGRLGISLAAYALSLLSKGMGISLPVLLILLDIYPLRRISRQSPIWRLSQENRVLLLEKIPYVILALTITIIGFMGQYSPGTMRTMLEYDTSSRICQACFGLSFYLLKTLVPIHLSPLYELPVYLNIVSWRFILSGIMVLCVSSALWALRHKYLPVLLVWIYYVVTLLPVLGFVQFGAQIAADRYTYLSCLGWAMLLGGSFLKFGNNKSRKGYGYILVSAIVVAAILGLSVLTWKQTKIWHDSETLWSQALAIEPANVAAHINLGVDLANRNKLKEASEYFRAALVLNPGDVFDVS